MSFISVYLLERTGKLHPDQREGSDDQEAQHAESGRKLIPVGPCGHLICRARQDIRIACELIVHPGRTALCDHVNIAKVVEICRKRRDYERDGELRHQGEGNRFKALEFRSAVHLCRLVILFGDCLKSAEADIQHIRESEPDIDDDDSCPGPEGVGHPGDIGRDADPMEEIIDSAVLLIQKSLPGKDCNGRRQRPRNDQECPVDLRFLHVRVIEEHRKEKSHEIGTKGAERRKRDRPPEHRKEHTADLPRENLNIVGKSHEREVVHVEHVVVRKGNVDRIDDRYHRNDEYRDQGRGQIPVCFPVVPLFHYPRSLLS